MLHWSQSALELKTLFIRTCSYSFRRSLPQDIKVSYKRKLDRTCYFCRRGTESKLHLKFSALVSGTGSVRCGVNMCSSASHPYDVIFEKMGCIFRVQECVIHIHSCDNGGLIVWIQIHMRGMCNGRKLCMAFPTLICEHLTLFIPNQKRTPNLIQYCGSGWKIYVMICSLTSDQVYLWAQSKALLLLNYYALVIIKL